MINEAQKALVKVVIDTVLEETPEAIKLKAFKSILSISEYIANLDELIEYKIEGDIKTIGEMLSHPAPENPAHSNVHSDRVPSDSALPFYQIFYRLPAQSATPIRKGIFNLKIHDTQGSPVTQSEISDFIQNTIESKIIELEPNYKTIAPNAKKRQLEVVITPENFLEQTLETQLNFLQMTVDHCPPCDENNFIFCQLFLKQFKNECKTIQEINALLPVLHRCRVYDLTAAKVFVGTNNEKSLTLASIFEASINSFECYLLNPNASFYAYRALIKFAIASGFSQHIPQLEPHYADIASSLIQRGHSKELDDLISKHGHHIDVYHANELLGQTFLSPFPRVLISALSLPFANDCLNKLAQKFFMQESFNIVFAVLLLASPQFIGRFSINLSKKVYQKAIELNNFELQVLVLLHSTPQFEAREFLTADTFHTLVIQKKYYTAHKMASMCFPGIISKADLLKAKEETNGFLDFLIPTNVNDSVPPILNALPQHQAGAPSLVAQASSSSQPISEALSFLLLRSTPIGRGSS